MLLNVRDYADPASALAQADDGDAVCFPAIWEPYVAPAGGWQITKSIEIRGDGPGLLNGVTGTVLESADRNSPVLVVVPPAASVYVHDLQLRAGTQGTAGQNGVGIRCRSDASNPTSATNLQIRRVTIVGFAGHGIHLEGFDAGNARIRGLTLMDSLIRDCGGAGVFLKNVFGAYVSTLNLERNQLSGLMAEGCSLGVFSSTFDGNNLTFSPGDGNLRFKNCLMAKAEACRFVNFELGTVNTACVIDGGVASVGSCYFETATTGASAGTGIVATRTESSRPFTGPLTILSNRFIKTTKLIDVDSNVVDCVLFPQYYDGGPGTINLPSPNNAMLAMPHRAGPSTNNVTGLIVPSGVGDPFKNLVNGMIAYNAQTHQLRLRTNGQWKSIVVSS